MQNYIKMDIILPIIKNRTFLLKISDHEYTRGVEFLTSILSI